MFGPYLNSLLDIATRFSQPARIAINLVLLCILGILFARIAWSIIPNANSTKDFKPRQLPAIQAQSTANLTVDRTVLLKINPFKTTETVELAEDVPETRLNLTLTGVFVSSTQGAGSAHIRLPDNSERRFIPQDEVVDGTILERIETGRVILLRNGEREVLLLEGRGEGLSVISSPETFVPGASSPRSATSGPEVEVVRVDTSRNHLMQSLNIGTQSEGDKNLYVVKPRGHISSLEALGLRPGDVIRQLDGQAIEQFEEEDLFDIFATTRELNLSVERDEKPINVSIRLIE